MGREVAVTEHEGGRTVVDADTGEVMETLPVVRDAPQAMTFGEAVERFASEDALKQQQAFTQAYDKACRALIGPNDVQKEGKREFKKKSAWRKLGRAFGISTEIVREESHYDDDGHLVSTVVVRATAPWGQSAEAIGKCSTREPRFKRQSARAKADHDCPATAQTRATNRATSDLIAAGEVSYEEVQGGGNYDDDANGNGAKPPATDAQKDFIRNLVGSHHVPEAKRRKIRAKLGEGMTKDEASKTIKALQRWIKEGEAKEQAEGESGETETGDAPDPADAEEREQEAGLPF